MENEELQKLITTLDSLGYRIVSIAPGAAIIDGVVYNRPGQTALVISSAKNEKK